MIKYGNGKDRIAFVLFLALLYAAPGFAQKFSATASKVKVAAGEPFQVSYTANTTLTGFKPPSFADFTVYSGPNNYTSYQVYGGQQTVSNTISYVIAAKKEGKITLAPASIVVNGNRVESNALVIEVVKGSSSAQQNAQAPANNTSENLFTRTSVNRTKVYLGEQVSVTHKIYTRLQLRGFQDVKFPSYNGFWSQEIPTQSQINLTSENIDGVVYNVAEMKKTFLFPQRTGTLEIGTAEFDCIVRQKSNRAPRDIFEQFMGTGGYEDALMKISSRPVKIEVMPLPEQDKPAQFTGAVGNFSFKASVDKEKLKVNEAVNLKISVSGKGNLKLIEPFNISFPEGIEAYDPKVNDNVSVTAAGVSGSKTFEYLLIPRRAGEYTIGPVNFSYFNPDKKSYVVIPSPQFNFQVEKGDGSSGGENSPVLVTQQDVQLMGNDIRYIKSNPESLVKKEDYFFGSPGFIAGVVSPALAFLLFLFVRKRQQELTSDLSLVKSRRAARMAQKRLFLASGFMKENKKEEFYAEVLRALQGYFSDKLSIPVSELSKETVLEALREKQVGDITLQALAKITDECEFARYAPSAVQSGLENTYNEAASIISTIETELK